MKDTIFEQYPYRIELHAHTSPCSSCGKVDPEELVHLYREKGYHGVVLTNHFEPGKLEMGKAEAVAMVMRDYETARNAAKNCGMAVYLGLELRFQENFNDYLIYGVNEEMISSFFDYISKDVATFRKEVALPDSVFLQAHPFRPNMELCDPSLLDGIECLNLHPRHNSAVALATQYAYDKDLKIKIAGGDSHRVGDQGLAALRTKVLPKDSFEIARILKSGDYVFDIGGGSLWIP